MKAPSRLVLQDQEKRQHVVAWALSFTQDTALAPDPYEQALLTRFVEGSLTIDQVVEQLEKRAI